MRVAKAFLIPHNLLITAQPQFTIWVTLSGVSSVRTGEDGIGGFNTVAGVGHKRSLARITRSTVQHRFELFKRVRTSHGNARASPEFARIRLD
jgi:hypothetical protein